MGFRHVDPAGRLTYVSATMHIYPAAFLLSKLAWACFFSMSIAQILKPFCARIEGKPMAWGRMFYTGGMPSSHTSLVTTLTLGIWSLEGPQSTITAICLIFSLYFIFEATGLRQEVGQQAKVLNEMFDELYQTHHVDRQRLKELVGHTWTEVLGGGVIGFAVFWFSRSWIQTH